MIPKYLCLRNFLSHDLSKLDFTKFSMALILGSFDSQFDQSNCAGKSSLFEGITWALFEKSRHKKKDGVVKWDRKSCKVEFEFWVENALYRVVRVRDKVSSEAEISLEQWDDSKQSFTPISCDTNTATNAKIVKIIGFSYEVFVNSVYFKQDDISVFATSTPTKRKDILKSLLQIDQWDNYQKKTKDKARDLNSKIEEKSQRLIPIDSINKEIEQCRNCLVEVKKQIKDINQEYSIMNSSLMSKKLQYQSAYGNLVEDEHRLKLLQQEYSSAKKRLLDIQSNRVKNDSALKSNSDQLAVLNKKIDVLKIKIVEGRGINLEELRSKIIVGKTKEKILKDKIQTLEKEIEFNDKCNLCKRPLTKQDIEKIKADREQELSDIKVQHTDIQQKLTRAEEKLKDKEFLFNESAKSELEKARTEVKINKLQNALEDCESLETELCKEQKGLESKDFKKGIDELKAKFNKEEKEKLSKEISDLEHDLQDIKKRTDKLNIEYGSKANNRDELIKTEQEQSELQKDVNKLKSEYVVYDKLRDYFGKDGIQAVIIENVIEELENYANETLSKICNEPTSISIVTQKQNDNGSWSETFDINVKEGSRTDDFDTLSGGGKFRISLALRLALSSILAKRMNGNVKMLMLDEAASSLDKKGIDTFLSVIKQLSNSMKILVISHDERLKEKFNDIIVVNKTSVGSKVVV
ncbi:MAG: SMC family ATPase [Patescibacteria group bacterium]